MLVDVQYRNSTGRPADSSGRPVEILLDVPQKFFIAFVYEIGNSKTFEANMQNSSGRPAESYLTSSRIQWTSNRSSTGRPLDQIILANNAVLEVITYCTIFSIFRALCKDVIRLLLL